jgi:hypothetical protein
MPSTDIEIQGVTIYDQNSAGEIIFCSFAGTILPTTAGKFAIGCKIIASDGKEYYNEGTVAVPSWNATTAITIAEMPAGLTDRKSYEFFVDGSRTDTYTATGTATAPYKTIKAAQDAINVISATLLSSQELFDTSRFIVNITPGTYSDNISILTARFIRYNMKGVTISGNLSITQEQVGISDYYGKVEFVGDFANRADKGKCAKISGDITFNKTAYDSLAYDSFIGVEITGDIKYGATAGAGYGTWVLHLKDCSLSNTAKSITTNFAAGGHCLLIETEGWNEIKHTLTGVIDLYDCNNTSFRNIDITPANGCEVKNSKFTGTVSIVAAKTLSIDANSYISLLARTPTLTGMTVSLIDGIIPDTTTAAQEEVTTTGAISIAKFLTTIDTSAGATAYTLANGSKIGQLKKIIMRVDNGDATITGSFAGTANTLTFSDAGEYALLQWNGTDWVALELLSYLNMTHAPVLSTV